MARKNIQGITIEIGGDTTKLQTALKGVESKLKDTQYALKDVNKLLKMDPGNVELLTDAISGTKDKLDTLKDAQEQMVAAGKVDTAEYDALQREIIETEQQLGNLTDEMKNFGSVSAQQLANAGEKVKDVGDKMQTVGTALTKYVTTPIVAVGTASVAAFNEVDEGLDTIVKKTGATGDALTDMEDRAKNLATTIPTTFKTAGAAVGEVNTRFGLTGQELEDLSAKFIKFADLNDTDVSSSIDNVQAAMAAFGMDAYDAADALDIINKAAQDTGVNVSKLTSDMTSNAATLEEMGMGFNTSAGFLANLNKNGLDSSAVLTGMKKALQNATKNGKSMESELQRMQVAIKGAKTETDAMKIATELFGSKAAPALVKAVRDGRISFNEAANSVTNWVDSIDNTFEATQDPIDSLKTSLNELKIVGLDLVNAAAPFIKEFANTVKTAVSNIRSWWEGLSPMVQQTIIKAAAIAAAVGPVLVVVGKITSAVGGLMAYAPKIVGVISSLSPAISGVVSVAKAGLSGVIGLISAHPVVAAITGVVAGLVLLYNKCEWFRDAVNALWEGIVNAAKAVGEALKKTFQDKFDNIKAAYEKHGGGMKGVAAAIMQGIKEKITFGFDLINNLTGGKLDGLKDKVHSVWNGITDFFRNALEKIKSFFSFQWELPKIKLPHFSIQGQFSLNPPQVPHLAVEWYKKAMQDGMILSSPTILPAANGSMRGYGDAGPEAVVGVSSLRNMINSAVAAAMPKGGAARNLTVILEIDGQKFARAEVPYIDEEVTRRGVQLATT